ncbi:MAG: hypothetical protein H9535_19300 [Ignavibacteria bacterium]|nr:hypothetical protein [Ignavibacteria bacterium]
MKQMNKKQGHDFINDILDSNRSQATAAIAAQIDKLGRWGTVQTRLLFEGLITLNVNLKRTVKSETTGKKFVTQETSTLVDYIHVDLFEQSHNKESNRISVDLIIYVEPADGAEGNYRDDKVYQAYWRQLKAQLKPVIKALHAISDPIARAQGKNLRLPKWKIELGGAYDEMPRLRAVLEWK